MADEEQLRILLAGVTVWNDWREKNHHTEIDLRDANLEKLDLENVDLSHAALHNANLSFARLRNANFSYAHLSHANLSHADLRGAHLAFAHMERTVLLYANMKTADLRGAYLKHASLEDANLNHANLSHAHLEKAVLVNANCRNAEFLSTNFTGANMTAVNLEGANFSAVQYDRKVTWKVFRETGMNPRLIWKRWDDIILGTTIRCRGINANCYGSQHFRQFLQDQDYLEELMETAWGRKTCFVWWLFADCGRSVVRWALWSLVIAFMFALIYLLLGPGHFRLANLPFNFASTIYYSIVTFTTLGFGDFVPASNVAAAFVMIEVVSGYVMLGGLISIFSFKLARRGG